MLNINTIARAVMPKNLYFRAEPAALSGENAYYHLIAKCPVMNFYNGHAVTLDYTLSNGIDACPVCNPPSDVIA